MSQNFSEQQHLECVITALENSGYKCRVCLDTDADYVVAPVDGSPEFKLQVWKGFVIAESNRKRGNIHVAFCDGESVYCYPHNKVLDAVCQEEMEYVSSRSWQQFGFYFMSPQRRKNGLYFKAKLARLLAPHRVSSCTIP